MTTAMADTGGRREAGWRTALFLAAVAVGIGLLYRDAVAGAWRVWLESTVYNHCLLVLPLAAFMFWNRRQRLTNVHPRVEWPMLALLVPVVLVWLCGRLFSVLEVQQFAVVTMLQVSALVLFGWPVYRRLIAPFLFLYLLVPTGMFLVLPLQNFTAKFVILFLQLTGIPVLANGTVIKVSSGTFVVAEACAGLRFLIAAIAFGIFYACEVYASIARRLAFIALCFIIPIFANGLRAFGLVFAAELLGTASAIEADHILYGWLFFSMVLFALIYIGRFFADRSAFTPYLPVAEPPGSSTRRAGRLDFGLAAVACLLLAAAGPLAQQVLAMRGAVSLPAGPPPVPAGWQAAAPSSDWRPKARRSDRVFFDTIQKDGRRIDRFVALYRPHGNPSSPASGEDRLADPEVWRPVQASRRNIIVEGQTVPLQTLEAVAPGDKRRIVWGFYMAGRRPAASGWTVRWYAFQSYITASRCPAAFIAVSTTDSADSNLLQRYLTETGLLGSYVCG
jgi:exosortase A